MTAMTATTAMTVTVNGEERAVASETTVAALIADLGFGPRRVAVEVNCDVVPADEYQRRRLAAGDVVEIVHFVGGG
jgi:thiamine biosynthesis protein ThiS